MQQHEYAVSAIFESPGAGKIASDKWVTEVRELRGYWGAQVQALQDEADRQAAEVARLHATTPPQLYNRDLDAFEAALAERDAETAREADLLIVQQKRAGRSGHAAKVGAHPLHPPSSVDTAAGTKFDMLMVPARC